jgi:L-alanine-DL-glutamate epimerase-like enolase superfamily enzyme
VKITTHLFDLPLRDPFTIARGTATSQPTMIVELSDGNFTGFGEATSNDFYAASIPTMLQDLRQVQQVLPTLKWDTPETLWDLLDPMLGHNRFAQAALDMAAYDLWGKKLGKPVWQLLGLNPKAGPQSCYTLGIDTPDTMLRKMQAMPGWPIYKIKCGTPNDLETIRFLRTHTTATFRVDANCGWKPEQVVPMATELKQLGVEFIEQPLPVEHWADMAELKPQSPLPLMADESCPVQSSVERCAAGFHAINIKLVKCGGVTPARRMIEMARQLGLKIMVGCMTESSIGISAAAQLKPLLDFADLDGAVLLKEDLADGVRVEKGQIELTDKPGNGVSLKQNLEHLRIQTAN